MRRLSTNERKRSGVCTSAIARDENKFDIVIRTQVCARCRKFRQLRDTRRTRGRKEIDDQNPAALRRDRDGSIADRLQREGRRERVFRLVERARQLLWGKPSAIPSRTDQENCDQRDRDGGLFSKRPHKN